MADEKIDPRSEPAEQPKTTQLPAADKTDIQFNELKILITAGLSALDSKVAIGFKEQDIRLARVEANIDVLGNEIGNVKKEVGLLYSWKDDVDSRLKTNSMRAKAPSAFDMEQDARLAVALSQLAEEKARREKLEETAATKEDLKAVADKQTTDIVTSVSKLAEKNPTVRHLLTALAAVAVVGLNTLMTYLATKGH